MKRDEIYNLSRFVNTQSLYFNDALRELRSGRKRSLWLWFFFPQLKALGYSDNAKYYGISGLAEAEAVLGWPDHLKLKSCMTFFEQADKDNEIYGKVLEEFYNGKEILRHQKYLKVCFSLWMDMNIY